MRSLWQPWRENAGFRSPRARESVAEAVLRPGKIVPLGHGHVFPVRGLLPVLGVRGLLLDLCGFRRLLDLGQAGLVLSASRAGGHHRSRSLLLPAPPASGPSPRLLLG